MSAKNFLVSPGPPIDTDSGQVAGPGETVKVDPDNDHNRRLVETGRLVELSESTTKEPTKAELQARAGELDVAGRSSMNVDQLKAAIAEAEAEANPDKENA